MQKILSRHWHHLSSAETLREFGGHGNLGVKLCFLFPSCFRRLQAMREEEQRPICWTERFCGLANKVIGAIFVYG